MLNVNSSNYWISSHALNISLNALGKEDYALVSVVSGAVIMAYMKGVIDFDPSHNFRKWQIEASPTVFGTTSEKFLYIAIPRTESVGNKAIVVFPSERIDIYGKAERTDTNGNVTEVQVGSEQYYYFDLQGRITPSEINGSTVRRDWANKSTPFLTGLLSSDEALSTPPTQSEWYEYDSSHGIVTFLKNLAMKASTVFERIYARTLSIVSGGSLAFENGSVTEVANSTTSPTSYRAIVTPAYIYGKYLSKQADDTANGHITFQKGTDIFGNTVFGTYNKGISGATIQEDGFAEFGEVVIRSSLTVPQITYNNIEVIAGNTWRTAGGGTILKTATIGSDNVAMLKLKDAQVGRIKADDLCQGVWHMSSGNDTTDSDAHNGNFHFSGFTTVYFRVEQVYTNASSADQLAAAFGITTAEALDGISRKMFFRYTLRCNYLYTVGGSTSAARDLPTTDPRRWTGNTHPQPQMNFAAYANLICTDRQQCRYETPSYKIQLVGMTDWVYGPANIEAIYDDLNGFSIIDRNGKVQQLSGWGAALGNLYMWGNIQHIDRAPIVTSQRIWAILLATTATPVPGTADWTSDNIQTLKPTEAKQYLWHVFEYTYDREDSSAPRWSAPWLAAQWGAPGQDGTDGINGLDAVQPNLYGYDNKVISYQNISYVCHTPTGIAAYLNKVSSFESEWTVINIDLGDALQEGHLYSVSMLVKSSYVGKGVAVEFKDANYSSGVSAGRKTFAPGEWYEYTGRLVAKQGDSMLVLSIQNNSKSDSFSGLLDVRNLKLEDATHLAGTRTAFDGLAPSSEQQPDNLIADARLICDRNRWRTYLDGAHSVSNLAHGMSGYESQNVLVAANGERDVLEQSLAGRIKANTWYTLSYYARLTQDLNGVHIQTFVYPSTSSVPSLAVADGEAYISQRNDGYHAIDTTDGVTEWRRHSLTFRTPASLPADYKVLWRIVNPYGSNQTRTIQICAPMLNETEQLFDWQEANTDRVGAMPRPCGEWRSGSIYVWNGNFRDIVIYESNYYAVKREGSEVTSVPTNGSDWELADRFSFVATDLLLATQAFVENLGVRIVQTAQDNEPRIVMQGSQFQMFGNLATPSIQMAVRADGVAVLEFYDANGNKMYDLGPESITQQVSSEQSRFHASDNVAPFDLTKAATKANLTTILNLATTQYYLFREGWKMVGTVKQYYLNGEYNNKVYDSNKVIGKGEQARPAGTPIASGGYFGEAMPMLNRSSAATLYGRKYFYVVTSGSAPQHTDRYLIYKKDANGTMSPCDINGTLKQVGTQVRIADLLETIQ